VARLGQQLAEPMLSPSRISVSRNGLSASELEAAGGGEQEAYLARVVTSLRDRGLFVWPEDVLWTSQFSDEEEDFLAVENGTGVARVFVMLPVSETVGGGSFPVVGRDGVPAVTSKILWSAALGRF